MRSMMFSLGKVKSNVKQILKIKPVTINIISKKISNTALKPLILEYIMPFEGSSNG